MKALFAAAALAAAGQAQAHSGHGLTGAHWHATDVLGFVALAAVIAALLWHRRGR